MSQVTFRVPLHTRFQGPLEVMAGWDPPLRWFFLTVTQLETDTTIYCNLDEASPRLVGQDTTFFEGVLSRLGITPPPGFWELVRRKENGSTIHRFDEEGKAHTLSPQGVWHPRAS